MKIVFVYDAIYPWIKGGAERRIYEIARRLVKRGHEVHWYGLQWWKGPTILLYDGIYLHGVIKSRPLYVHGRRSILEAMIFSLLLLPVLAEESDIIECQQSPYLSCVPVKWYAWRHHTPLVITWHEYWGMYWTQYLGFPGFMGYWIERIVATLTRYQVTISGVTQQRLETQGGARSTVIPNGVDIEEIQRIEKKGEPTDIIFAGRLIPEKHVDLLIRAVKRVSESRPPVRCVIVGEGPERTRLEELVGQLRLRDQIRFYPYFEDPAELIAHFKASKIFVLPSTREGFSLVALEALACGLPVLTTDDGMNATRELVTEETGYLCPLSEGAFARTICSALERHGDMKAACIARASQFTWERSVRDTEEYYRGVLGLSPE